MLNNHNDNDFTAYLISLTTFLYGLNLMFLGGYLTNNFMFLGLTHHTENLISILFLISSMFKSVGIYKCNKKMKKIGIIMLSISWSIIVSLSLLEAVFNHSFSALILTAPILIFCLRIARRGEFN